MRRTHLTFTLIFVIGLSMVLWINFNTTTVKAVPTFHTSIDIDGNAALDAFCLGNGTSGNITHPHVIEDIEITFDGPQNGIKITNTDRYLVIENVNVSEFFQSTLSKGIYLINTSHITIENSHFYNNSYGIVFENTNDSRIVDTSGSINKVRGISFENCHNNTLYNVVAFENGLEENEGNGMDLISSNNNTIEYSIFLENWGHGLFLDNSHYNTVFNTSFLYNHGDCFLITNDPGETNNFYDNNCKKRGIPGAPIGVIALVSFSTIVILVLVTKKLKKKS
ncbi:MAG: NosD domain-containing protein [Promethearchaeota archaeon]